MTAPRGDWGFSPDLARATVETAESGDLAAALASFSPDLARATVETRHMVWFMPDDDIGFSPDLARATVETENVVWERVVGIFGFSPDLARATVETIKGFLLTPMGEAVSVPT